MRESEKRAALTVLSWPLCDNAMSSGIVTIMDEEDPAAMKTPAILAGKSVATLSRLLGRGSGLSYPGLVAERLHPPLVTDLARSLPGGVAVVTGTNGKTSTSKMLGDAFADGGRLVVRNDSGSNLRQGIVSTFVRAARPLGGGLRGDVAVLEVDEATMPAVCSAVSPRVICVTNLFRDQLDRFGDIDTTAALIGRGLAAAPGATVLLNADDPAVAHLAEYAGGPVAYFGIDGTVAGSEAARAARDSARCPHCAAPLEFALVRYAHLGEWRCPECGLTRPEPEFTASDVVLGSGSASFDIVAQGMRTHVELPVGGLHNVYNAVAAFASAVSMGSAPEDVVASFEHFVPAFGRAERLDVGGTPVTLMLTKNPSGAERSLAAALDDPRLTALGLALNDNAADGTDVSWIWDVDLESLDLSACTFVLAGSRAEDAAVRFKYAGVDERRLHVCHDPVRAVELLASRAGERASASMLATYTAMLEIRSAFAPPNDRFARLGKELRHDG